MGRGRGYSYWWFPQEKLRGATTRTNARHQTIGSYDLQTGLRAVQNPMSILYRSVAALFLFSLPALAGSSVQGINNFHQVDEHVYRGAQPTAAGFKYLATDRR